MRSINVYDKHVAFWGSFLSNFFPCEIKLDEVFEDLQTDIEIPHIIWKSSEQCFMAFKAKTFNDYETLREICLTERPEDAKKLGRKVKNFDDNVWALVRRDIMKKILIEKFTQNERLRANLLSDEYKGKTFVEGSPFDKIWGVGLRWDNAAIDKPSQWKGENLLGQILTEIRDELLNEEIVEEITKE